MKQNIDDISCCDDELNLYSYMIILWKRKFFLICLFCLSIMITLFILLNLPHIYKGELVLQPGVQDIKPDGSLVFVESPEILISKINNNVYSPQIIDTNKQFKIESKLTSSNLSVITVNIYSTDKLFIQKFSKDLLNNLIKNYTVIIDKKKKYFEDNINKLLENVKKNNEKKKKEIEDISFDIKIIKENIETDKNKLKIINENIKLLDNNVTIIKEKIKNIETNYDSILSKNQNYFLLYSNIIQQKLLQLDAMMLNIKSDKLISEDINSAINKNEVIIEHKKNIIVDIQYSIKKSDIELNTLINNNYIEVDIKGLFQENIYNEIISIQNILRKISIIDILKDNTSNPIKSDYPLVKILTLVSISSMIIGIGIIFFIEYIIKQKKINNSL